MRQLGIIKTITLVSTIFLGTSVFAQFREIGPNGGESTEQEELQPTKSRFVPPKVRQRVNEQVSKAEPTPVAVKEIKVQDSQAEQQPISIVEPQTSKTKSLGSTDSAGQATQSNLVQPSSETKASTSSNAVTAKSPVVEVAVTPQATKQNIVEDQNAAITTPQSSESKTPVESQSVESTETNKQLDPLTLFESVSGEESESPIAFNGIQVGKTTFAEVKELWGEPAKIVEVNGTEKLLYGNAGVKQIGVLANSIDADDEKILVDAIEIHVEEELPTAQFAKNLGIENTKPVEVLDDAGEPLGLAFPENGVLFGYGDSHRNVRLISIEPIRAEAFVLRAEDETDFDYTQDLADLETAIRLNDADAHPHWLKAEILAKLGDNDQAFESVRRAVQLSDQPEYQLTKARLEAEIGSRAKATRELHEIIEDKSVHAIVRARAQSDLGNLLATGPDANFEKAMEAHLEAIDTSAPERKSSDYKIRRTAKRILVDAHMAVAQDIALGNYQRKGEVVPKWLVRASELAENYIENDGGDSSVRLDIFRATLGIYSILPGNFDASVAAEDALTEGRRLIGKSTDEGYQRTIQRKLIETLYYAAKVEQRRGRTDSAKKFTNNAIALLDQQIGDDRSTFDEYVAGQIFFLAGSIQAINDSNHSTACEWYTKAYDVFEKEQISTIVKTNSFGEQYVSMGISFWENGNREFGIEITEKGAKLMEEAVQDGALPLAALSIPYGNLATMHKDLGNSKDVKHYTEMMAKVTEKETKTR